MEHAYYTNEPEPVQVQRYNGNMCITVIANIARAEGDSPHYEGDTATFWVREGELNLEEVAANPAAWLNYIPQAVRQDARDKAQGMLHKLRGGRPVIPVPSLREGAAVAASTDDKAMFSAALARGCGLPVYELASGEVVSLTLEQMQGIYDDVAAAECAMQTAKHVCWQAIEAATSQQGIDAALAEFAAVLNRYTAANAAIHP